MTDDLSRLETWAGGLLQRMAPPARRRLAREVGTDLRRSQRERIAAQRNPDGSRFAPRKQRNLRGKKGRIKRRRAAMFQKLRTAKYMRVRADASYIDVGFFGRVARIARVHQDGTTDEVERGGPRVRYPARRLLGFTARDIERIRDRILGAFER